MKAPAIITKCKENHLSIASYYGRISLNGKKYYFIPRDKALVRSDCFEKFARLRKKGTDIVSIQKDLAA